MSAGRARLRGVGRVHLHDQHAGSFRLVGDEAAKLVERPGVQRGPLGLAEPDPAADAPEVSRAMPRPVRSASATMRLAMTWLVSVANRASLRRRCLSSRLALLVPLRCSLVRSRRLRWRTRFKCRPTCRFPSDVVAMLTIPRSIPRNPAGLVWDASEASQVEYRYHLPSRQSRSDSPLRWASNAFWCSPTVNRRPLSRPAVVQMLTVPWSGCQDRQRSS